MRTSDVLRKAGDVLRERGWCQYTHKGLDGNVCAFGALNAARTGDPTDVSSPWPGDSEFETVLGCVNGANWNDAKGRTAAEVMYALDAAYVLALQLEGEDPADYEVL
jgi:hypothetical protein